MSYPSAAMPQIAPTIRNLRDYGNLNLNFGKCYYVSFDNWDHWIFPQLRGITGGFPTSTHGSTSRLVLSRSAQQP
jgi:hypothetical protein